MTNTILEVSAVKSSVCVWAVWCRNKKLPPLICCPFCSTFSVWVITSLFLGEEAGESLFWRGVAPGSCAAAGLFGRTRKFNTQVQHWYSAEQCLASASASQYWQTREGGREKAEKRTLPQRHLLALAGRTLVDKPQPAFISTELRSGGSRPGLW